MNSFVSITSTSLFRDNKGEELQLSTFGRKFFKLKGFPNSDYIFQ